MKIYIIIFLTLECLFFQTSASKNKSNTDNSIEKVKTGGRQKIKEVGGKGHIFTGGRKPKPTEKTTEVKQTLSTVDNNKYEIYDVLEYMLKPPEIPHTIKFLLEIGSGSGEHIGYIAPQIDFVDFQPTECNMEWFPIIQMYRSFAGVLNILPVQYLNVNDHYSKWGNNTMKRKSYEYILNVDMLQVVPWPSIVGLFMGSAHVLKMDGLLFIYGPFANNGTITPKNVADFDARLRNTNRAWGLRDITEELIPLGEMVGFRLLRTFDLAANDKMLVFQKVGKIKI